MNFASTISDPLRQIGPALAGLGLLTLFSSTAPAQTAAAQDVSSQTGFGAQEPIDLSAPYETLYALAWSGDVQVSQPAASPEASNTATTTTVPEPFSTMGKMFLRARIGRGLDGNLYLQFHVQPGKFGSRLTPSVSFPVFIHSYSAIFQVDSQGTYPPAPIVVFTGPTGTGLINARAVGGDVNLFNDYAWYQSFNVFNPDARAGGNWRIAYNGTQLEYLLANPQAASHLSIPVPSLTVSNDILRTVRWVYRNPATGVSSSSLPAFLTRVALQVEGRPGTGRLYDSDWLTPETRSHVPAVAVNWNSVGTLVFAYTDTLGNQYVFSYPR